MNYDQLASEAQARGLAAQTDYTNKANSYAGDYSNYKNQADTAQGQLTGLNDYMKGAGSATNLYNSAFDSQAGRTGYDQAQMANSMRNLSQAQGSLSAYNDYANTGASKWGLNAGGMAAANQGAVGSINNNIASASQGFANQQKAYELAQTGANQQAGLGVQQQQVQLAGYKQAYDNAFGQQQQAQSNMQFYHNLAQKQGGLTVEQVQGYQNSKALAAQAQASLAAAESAMAQARQTNYATTAQQEKDAAAKAAAQAATAAKSSGSVGPTASQIAQNHAMAQNRAGLDLSPGSILGSIGNWWNTSPLY